MAMRDTEIVIIGAGIVGIATAYFLTVRHGKRDIVILDPRAPMSLTSAASGENYRNWWPHRVMTRFTDRSIDLMEEIARASDNRLHMTRRGYALATRRSEIDGMIAQLHQGYGEDAARLIRIHEKGGAGTYKIAESADWTTAPDGVDVVRDSDLLRRAFPSFDPEVSTVIHIRRAGDISGQQMGQYMLDHIRGAGGRVVQARLASVTRKDRFDLEVVSSDGTARFRADMVVNAAGPYVGEVAAMLGESLPVETLAQQKIAFEDRDGAISRRMPFAIDLDGQTIAWTEEECALLAENPATAWLTRPMPGGIHCRPDGGDGGRWIKLGWAYNRTPGPFQPEPMLDPQFPDIVLRGASRLNAALKTYLGRLPRQFTHYGGSYTMTKENWPLIGPLATPGAFVVGALSGYGTMSACAAGELAAAHMCGGALPDYAGVLGLARHRDTALMAALTASGDKGVL
ncbi:MAG: FAD-binding oxidoreductase [Alphaproteobacteria bacterium]|nr:FAD-binding oxidoreductase [Alphaproteobacteria bacterium]